MANICSTSFVIEGSKETLDKILNAIKKPNVKEGSDESWGGNILRALGKDVEDCVYGFLSSYEEIKPTEDKDIFSLRVEWEDSWTRSDFVEELMEIFPDEIEIYWMSEEFGCEYWKTNDWGGKYFDDRYAVVTDEDWEYFKTEGDMLEYLKENFGINSRDEIENYNENNEDGNTITVYECEEE